MSTKENELIEQYLPMVRRLTWQVFSRLPSNIEFDDLLQAGLMGLVDAARRYEEQDNATFETYASIRVRGAIIDEIRKADWQSNSVRAKSRAIENAIHVVSQRKKRAATQEEIIKELNISTDEYYKMLDDAYGTQIIYFEDLSKDADGASHNAFDFIADENGHNPLTQLLSSGMRNALVDGINFLPEREQMLLSLLFEQDLNQKEIAAVLEVSEPRVSQLRTLVISRLRSYLREQGWGEKPDGISYKDLI